MNVSERKYGALITADREALRDAVTHRTIDLAVEALEAGLRWRGKNGNAQPRVAFIKLAFDVAKLTAQQAVSINLMLSQKYGIRDESELDTIVRTHREASTATMESAEADGVALLRWVIEQDEARRGVILAALGGERVQLVAEGSNGVEHGNGHSNGAAAP